MNSKNWKILLKNWSEQVITNSKKDDEPNFFPTLPLEIIESGWLGYEGATEDQIKQAEAWIGHKLPYSYREFLKVTNGWRSPTPDIKYLWRTDEIDLFSKRSPDIFDLMMSYANDYPYLSDEEYFIYGEEQSPEIRIEYLKSIVEIAWELDGDFYLLNPEVLNPVGEWEAWVFNTEGSIRYPSFWDLMQDEYKRLLELINE